MEVLKYLGDGFHELTYQKVLSIEMNLQKLEHKREKEMTLQYKGQDIGTRRVGFFCGWKNNSRNKSSYIVRRCTPGSGCKLSGGIWNANRIIN